MRILLVEDDPWYAESLCSTIRNELDCEINTARSAGAAVAMIDSFQPNAIILDIMLGEQNGLVLLNELQSYIDTRSLPIIILSLNTDKLDLDDLCQFGVRAILDKATITPDSLATTITDAVGAGSG